MPYEEQWVRTKCPNCDVVNWFFEPSTKDDTNPWTLAIGCHSCETWWWRDGMCNCPDSIPSEIQSDYLKFISTKGKKFPE